MQYQFNFTVEQVQALWQCIQSAPIPRGMTDDLAAAFRAQVEAQNKTREEAAAAEIKAKANGANGHADAATP